MRWGDIIEVFSLLVPVLIMTAMLIFVYSMCLDLGIAMLYAKFPLI